MQALVLASGSQYRAGLLARPGIEFQVISPDIDESARTVEPPARLTVRLAAEKAEAARNTLLGKPLHVENACRQLASMSGQTVTFYTSLHLLNVQTNN